MELLLATRNQHKIHEIRTLIEPISKLQLVGLEDVGLNYEEREAVSYTHLTLPTNREV